MEWDPLPITISCFNRLHESYQQGLAWQARAEELLTNGAPPTPLTSLEKLANESTRLGCVLPKAKEVRVRLAAVRALVADIDAALPAAANKVRDHVSGCATYGGGGQRVHLRSTMLQPRPMSRLRMR